MDDFQILTQSIGEYAVDTVGRDNLRALELIMNPRDMTGHLSIALTDGSADAQKTVLRALFDVEQVFFDEAVLSYSFVDEIDDDEVVPAAASKYSYA